MTVLANKGRQKFSAIFHINAVLCFKKNAFCSVPLKVIVKVE